MMSWQAVVAWAVFAADGCQRKPVALGTTGPATLMVGVMSLRAQAMLSMPESEGFEVLVVWMQRMASKPTRIERELAFS